MSLSDRSLHCDLSFLDKEQDMLLYLVFVGECCLVGCLSNSFDVRYVFPQFAMVRVFCSISSLLFAGMMCGLLDL